MQQRGSLYTVTGNFVHTSRKTSAKWWCKQQLNLKVSLISQLEITVLVRFKHLQKQTLKAKITPTINSLIKFCNLVQKKTFTKKETLFNGSTFYVKPSNHKAYRQVCVMEFSPKASKTEFVLKFVHTFRGYAWTSLKSKETRKRQKAFKFST